MLPWRSIRAGLRTEATVALFARSKFRHLEGEKKAEMRSGKCRFKVSAVKIEFLNALKS